MLYRTQKPQPVLANALWHARLALAVMLLFSAFGARAAGQQAADPETKTPKLVHKVDPEYTGEALEAGVAGDVVLDVDIDAKGNVEGVRVKQSLDKGLDENAVAALRKWKFQPATRNGEPVPVSAAITVRFAVK